MGDVQLTSKEPICVQVGYTHSFIDEYLNSIKALMYQAKNNKYDIHDYIYTMPTIIFAISFLESAFDLFLYDLENINFCKISRAQKDKIIEKYTKQLEKLKNRYTIEQKYNDVLSVMGHDNINNTSNIVTIRKVRNYIIHDKVELLAPWVNNTEDEIIKLLKTKFIPQSKVSNNNCFWFNYLNYNGTTWILNEVFNFYISFCSQLKINSLFKSKINEIQELHPCTVTNCQEEPNAK